MNYAQSDFQARFYYSEILTFFIGDRMRKTLITFLTLALLLPLPAALAQSKTATAKATSAKNFAEQITAEQIRAYLTFVASDEMEGRDTPSRGLDTTAKFIATMLKLWGAKPAGDDGTYFQHIALRRERTDAAACKADINGQAFTVGEDFLSLPAAGEASGQLVYGGSGWMVKAKNIDPYRGLNIKGKIVVLNAGSSFLPAGISRADLTGKAGEDFADPMSYAKQKGAVGVVNVVSLRGLTNWARFRSSLENGLLNVEKLEEASNAQLPAIYVGLKMAQALFQNEKEDIATIYHSMVAQAPVQSFEFGADKKLSFAVKTKVEKPMTQNVVAVFEGSDPVLKNEYVAIGAHYDHVGMRDQATNADYIFNGADDDGSGTTAVLAIAEALAKAPVKPKRSTLFVWHCGEEKGLWGSEYFVKFPTVALDRIVTQLNIDMIGRSKKEGDTNPRNRELSGPNEIYVIGSKMMSTELGALSERVNQAFLNVSFNYKYDDPKDPNRFFFRSDHFNYAQKGIPIIFYFDGVHEDYHQASDQVEKIDFQKMEKVTRTVFMTLWEVSNLPARPRVDKQLPAELTNH
jgi:hypothetical protein